MAPSSAYSAVISQTTVIQLVPISQAVPFTSNTPGTTMPDFVSSGGNYYDHENIASNAAQSRSGYKKKRNKKNRGGQNNDGRINRAPKKRKHKVSRSPINRQMSNPQQRNFRKNKPKPKSPVLNPLAPTTPGVFDKIMKNLKGYTYEQFKALQVNQQLKLFLDAQTIPDHEHEISSQIITVSEQEGADETNKEENMEKQPPEGKANMTEESYPAVASSSRSVSKQQSSNSRFIRLTVDLEFAQILAKNLASMGILEELNEVERGKVFRRLMCVLLQDFGFKFIHDLFETGLKLRFEKLVATSTIIPNQDDSVDDLNGNNNDDWSDENLLALLMDESEKLKKMTATTTSNQAELLCEKVYELTGKFSGESSTKMWTMHVNFPFWERGENQNGKLYGPNNIIPNNPIEKEGEMSENILFDIMLQSWLGSRCKRTVSENPEVSSAERVIQFKLLVEVKVEAKLGAQPTMHVLVQNAVEEDTNAPTVKELAKESILQILENTFQGYLLFQLDKWLKN